MIKKQIAKTPIGAISILACFIVVFLFLAGCSDYAGWEESPSGLLISLEKAEALIGPFDLMSDESDGGSDDWDAWDDWDDYSKLKPEDVDVDRILKAIAEMEKLDGYVLESGRVFRAESSLLLIMYEDLVISYDVLGDCERVADYYGKVQQVENSDSYIVVSIGLGSLLLVFPDHESYADAKKDDVYRINNVIIDNLKNCPIGGGQ